MFEDGNGEPRISSMTRMKTPNPVRDHWEPDKKKDSVHLGQMSQSATKITPHADGVVERTSPQLGSW